MIFVFQKKTNIGKLEKNATRKNEKIIFLPFKDKKSQQSAIGFIEKKRITDRHEKIVFCKMIQI